jgi:hypothetical protein
MFDRGFIYEGGAISHRPSPGGAQALGYVLVAGNVVESFVVAVLPQQEGRDGRVAAATQAG